MNSASAPTWDLTSYFPVFDGPEYRAHRDGIEQTLRDLETTGGRIGPLTSATAPAWKDYVLRFERVLRDLSHLNSYVGCLCAADSANEGHRREEARLASMYAQQQKAFVPFQAALREADDAAFEALAGQEGLGDARHFLERSRQQARYTMDAAREVLAADLGVDGLLAWGRLYDTLSGKLEFDVAMPDGTRERVPMAQKASRLVDPDPAVRKAVLDGSNAAWQAVEETAAACLNGIAGARLTLNRHRGVPHFLDVAMFDASVSRETIETMWRVVGERRELSRRYLRAKARAIGRERLGFQDLGAPLPVREGDAKIGWESGTAMMLDAFDASYPGLADFSRAMLAKRRVEGEKRAGKRPGAFCTTSWKSGESRVFMTWGESLGSLQTLAHELGHAWHGWLMRDMRPLARMYPMTLAETASTFAEDLLAGTLLDSPELDADRRARVLDERLVHASMFLLNIHMRYLFEERFHEERAAGEVSVSRLKELMLDAQRECYGDALEPEELDPYFWASKLHFYICEITFYNFPYTFGYLLSRGIAETFRREGPGFLPRYEEFLRLTGSDTAEGVARRALGIDLVAPGFWVRAVESLEAEIARFEQIVDTKS